MIEKNKTIINQLGLHARSASKLVSTASGYIANVEVKYKEKSVNAKSIMELLMLAAKQGENITIICDGEDESEAMDAVCNLIDDYFGEGK